jgi:hypothetical protein
LYRADNPHVAVHNQVRFENVNFAGFEIAEDFVKEFQGWLNTSRRKSGDVEPERVFRSMLCALQPRHGFGHSLND